MKGEKRSGVIQTRDKNEKEEDATRVWNDYLSFKTNSRVSAKSFANQKGEVGGRCQKEVDGCDEGHGGVAEVR